MFKNCWEDKIQAEADHWFLPRDHLLSVNQRGGSAQIELWPLRHSVLQLSSLISSTLWHRQMSDDNRLAYRLLDRWMILKSTSRPSRGMGLGSGPGYIVRSLWRHLDSVRPRDYHGLSLLVLLIGYKLFVLSKTLREMYCLHTHTHTDCIQQVSHRYHYPRPRVQPRVAVTEWLTKWWRVVLGFQIM